MHLLWLHAAMRRRGPRVGEVVQLRVVRLADAPFPERRNPMASALAFDDACLRLEEAARTGRVDAGLQEMASKVAALACDAWPEQGSRRALAAAVSVPF